MAETDKKNGYTDYPAVDLRPLATGGTLYGSDGKIYYDNPGEYQGVHVGVIAAELVLLVIAFSILLHGAYRKFPALVAWLRP